MTDATDAPAPDAGAASNIPEVSFVTPGGPELLRWAIEHYRGALPEGTTFPLARMMFATNVLLRDDKTVRRWLAGQTDVDPRVRAFLSRKWYEAGYGPRAYRREMRKLTPRQLLWQR